MSFNMPASTLTKAVLIGFFGFSVLTACDQKAPQDEAKEPVATAEAATVSADEKKISSVVVTGDETLPFNHPPLPLLEDQPQAEQAGQAMPEGHPAMPDAEAEAADDELAHPSVSENDPPVVLPSEFQGKWSAVLIEVVLADGVKNEMRIGVGKETRLGESGLTLRVESFVPSYMSDFDSITTASNELNNPAVKIQLLEGQQLVSKGWIFEKYPEFNSFVSDQVTLRLISAEAAVGGGTQTDVDVGEKIHVEP